MKRLVIIGIFLSSLIWSCSEDKLDTYEGNNSIYFAVRKARPAYNESLPYVDSTIFSFINYSIFDTVLYLRVNTLGDIEHFDRKFKAEVIESATTAEVGKHYDALVGEYVVPADSTYGLLPVRLHRTEDMREKMYDLKIRLLPTSDFHLALENVVVDKVNEEYVDLLQHTIHLSDFVTKPGMWDFSMDGMGKEPEMGKWSIDKYLLANYLMKIEPLEWEDESYMTIGRVQGISVFMRSFLMDMINKGTAVKDDTEPDGFMKVKGVIVPDPYTGTFVSALDLIK